jgi:hypothetical protein
MNDVREAKDELLERFDAVEEVLDLFDLEGAEYPNRESERTERLLPDLADSRPPTIRSQDSRPLFRPLSRNESQAIVFY